MEEKVAAEWGTERRSVEQKQQMDWGAAERGAGMQPLFWLLSLCRRFCCLSACLTCSVCPPARFHPQQNGVVLLSAQTLLSPPLNHLSLILISLCASPSSA